MKERGTDSSLGTVARHWQDLFVRQPTAFQVTSPRDVVKASRGEVIRALFRMCDLKGGEAVLEAGCAGGLYSLALAYRGMRCTALDLSEEMLKSTGEALASCRLELGDINVRVVRGDLTRLDLGSCYDVVFNEGVLEHWTAPADRIAVLKQMISVARPGGWVFVCIPNNSHPWYGCWHWVQRVLRSPQLIYRPRGPLEEAVIAPDELEREFREAGAVEISIDGFAVLRTIAHYPRFWLLRALVKAIELVTPPFPERVRKRWGVYLVAAGRRPADRKIS